MELVGEGRTAEPVAQPDERIDPEDAAERVPEQEASRGHVAHAGRERHEGAHQRHEAGEHDGQRTFLREIVAGGDEVAALEPPAVGAIRHEVAIFTAEPVASLVPDDGGDGQRCAEDPGIEVCVTHAREHSCNHK